MTKTEAPEDVIDYAEWPVWRAAGWTDAELGAHNAAIIRAREAAQRAAARPVYRTWTGRGEVRYYVNNAAELSGRDSRRTWVDTAGELHTDITLPAAVQALTAAVAAHQPEAVAHPRAMTDVEIHEYVAWIQDTEAQ